MVSCNKTVTFLCYSVFYIGILTVTKGRIFKELPGDAREILELVRRGKLKIEFQHQGLDELLGQQLDLLWARQGGRHLWQECCEQPNSGKKRAYVVDESDARDVRQPHWRLAARP